MHPFHTPMAILCMAVASAIVHAEESTAPAASAEAAAGTGEQPRIVVNAPRENTPEPFTGAAVDANNSGALRASTSDTAALLGGVPGVSLYNAGGVSNLPVIHGLADDRLRVEVDGMALMSACPNHMNPPLSYIDPTQVRSARVYAGISPVSLGGDSIGGTIVVESAKPEFTAAGEGVRMHGELGGYYRSNGNASGGHLSATLAGESVSLSYSGSAAYSGNYDAADDFKTFTATGRPGHTLPRNEVGSTAYRAENHILDLATKLGSHLIEANIGYQNIPYELYPNQRMDMLGNTENRFSLRDLVQTSWGSLEARAWHEEVDHYMDFGADKQFTYGAAPGIVAPGMPMFTESNNSGASIKGDVVLSSNETLRLGTEYQRYSLNDWWPPSPKSLAGMLDSMGNQATVGGMAPNTFWNIKDGERDRVALFTELETERSDQWSTLFGVRVEQVSMDTGDVQGYNNVTASYVQSAARFNAKDHKKTDTNWDFTALASYTPDANHTVEFGVAQKTRSPNLYERYAWSQNGMALEMNNFTGDGDGYLGNIDLKPEIARTASATLDWHAADRRWQLRATPYFTWVSDFIDADRCPGSGTGMSSLCGGAANNTATGKFVHLQFANHDARLWGVDLSGHMPLAQLAVGDFGVKGIASYVDGENMDKKRGLYNIMPPNGTLTLTHKLGGWDNALEWMTVAAKTGVSTVREEIKTPYYSLVNLRASYSWDRVRVDVGVENLFDKFYYLPTGGAYSGQGTTMSLNGIPWGIAVPGPGRSLYSGVTVKF